jgi:hypothetical protein
LDETIQFLIRHGQALLFGWVLLEQMGLPIPAVPLLLAAKEQERKGTSYELAICRGAGKQNAVRL